MRRALIFYGTSFVGKTTVEYNLRYQLLGNIGTAAKFVAYQRFMFLGQTFKLNGSPRITGGYDALTEWPKFEAPEWTIWAMCSAIPRNQEILAWEMGKFCKTLDEVHVIAMGSRRCSQNRDRRFELRVSNKFRACDAITEQRAPPRNFTAVDLENLQLYRLDDSKQTYELACQLLNVPVQFFDPDIVARFVKGEVR